MKRFLILSMSLMSYSLYAFECEMEVFYNDEPCTPINRPWAGPDARNCTEYSGGKALVTGELDDRGRGSAVISFNGKNYPLRCYPTFQDGRYQNCVPVNPETAKANFYSRYNGESLSIEGPDGRTYQSGLNRCF